MYFAGVHMCAGGNPASRCRQSLRLAPAQSFAYVPCPAVTLQFLRSGLWMLSGYESACNLATVPAGTHMRLHVYPCVVTPAETLGGCMGPPRRTAAGARARWFELYCRRQDCR